MLQQFMKHKQQLWIGLGVALLLALFSSMAHMSSMAYAQNGYPEPQDSYINDYANLLSNTDRSNTRDLLVDLRETHGVETTVLTIGSINDYETNDSTIESFATNLFNTWGIGDAKKNNGVLLLVAVNDRKVRIEVGTSYESTLNADMQDAINEHILPSFRDGNFSQGVYRGVRAITGEITGEWPTDLSISSSSTSAQADSSSSSSSAPVISRSSSSSSSNGLPFGVIAGGGAATLAAGGYGLKRYARYRKRRCPDCQTYMTRLDESADDVYLDSGQQLEEYLNSVDYDVWKCPNCNYHTLHNYNALFSGYGRCPSCRYRTLSTTSTTLEAATYHSTGRKRITRDCRHCEHHDEEIVVIPMKTRSESSSGSNSFGSSSGGGSFGGGRSSGGGASGSW